MDNTLKLRKLPSISLNPKVENLFSRMGFNILLKTRTTQKEIENLLKGAKPKDQLVILENVKSGLLKPLQNINEEKRLDEKKLRKSFPGIVEAASEVYNELVKYLEERMKTVPEFDFENRKEYYFERIKGKGDVLKVGITKSEIEIIQNALKKLQAQNFSEGRYYEGTLLYLDFLENEVQKIEPPNRELENFEPLEFENLNQKILLLQSLGVLNAISEKTRAEISSKKMGRILADLLNEKETTVTRALRYFHPHSAPKSKNNPRTEKNLEKLCSHLFKLKLPELAKIIEPELTKIYEAKD